MRTASFAFVLLLVTACSDVVVVPEDGTSSATGAPSASAGTGAGGTGASDPSGGGGAGGGPVEPREIEIAFDGEAGDNILVLLNEPDGSLVASWFGSELPVKPMVVDGQTVTFAYATSGGPEFVEARRVTPEVTRIEEHGWLPPACVEETMQVVVNVPAVGSASIAEVSIGTGGVEQLWSLPAVVERTARRCAGGLPTFDVLVTVGWGTFDAFELIQDIPFVPGTTVELTPTFATAPRSTMTIEVDQLADATSSGAIIACRGDSAAVSGPGFPTGHYFVAYERDLDGSFLGNSPFTYSPHAVDLPHGYQDAQVWVTFPPTDAACHRQAALWRLGGTAQPLTFHASALAEPMVDGDSWKLGEGELGQTLVRYGHDEDTSWSSLEDPARPPLPIVFPEFPEELPDGFEVPASPPPIVGVSHARSSGVASYAEALASAKRPFPRTFEARTSNLACP